MSPLPSMRAILCILLLVPSTAASKAPDRPRGVAKSKGHLYKPREDGTWTCLDDSKFILFGQINDDYCDCPDGSDEPGTSACPNGQFHCANAGHKAAYIPSSHVNDGVCDPECCDGSDEYDGQIHCPNTCKELGLAARKAAQEAAKTRLKGWKARTAYIETAKRKKRELEAERDRLQTKIVAAQQKEVELKIVLERAEAREGKVSRFGEKIADRARERIKEYKTAITGLRDEIGYLVGRVEKLQGILADLKKDHNQNYHDMAVKTAVSGWEELEKEEIPDFGLSEAVLDILEKEDVDLGDDDVDFTNEFDETVSLLYRIQDYFPVQVTDFIKEQIGYVRKLLVDQGFLKDEKVDGNTVSRALQKARDAHAQAVQDTSRLRTELETTSSSINGDFGPDDVFRAINGDCASLNTGEYTYTVCIMGQVTQKSNKDNTNTKLGSFARFEGDYTAMIYDHGLRCWNGPERSARVDMECGAENEVIKVTEPSKCEYLVKMRSPAVCTKPDGKAAKEEL